MRINRPSILLTCEYCGIQKVRSLVNGIRGMYPLKVPYRASNERISRISMEDTKITSNLDLPLLLTRIEIIN
jgi:hypothetical protein